MWGGNEIMSESSLTYDDLLDYIYQNCEFKDKPKLSWICKEGNTRPYLEKYCKDNGIDFVAIGKRNE